MSIPTIAKVLEIRRGTWIADTTSADQPTGSFEMGGETWSGTIIPTGFVKDGSRYYARIVGGKGRLGAQVTGRQYSGSISWQLIARDIILACGEVPGSIVGPGRVTHYDRQIGSAGQCLNTLCAQSGLIWWVGRDGSVNVGSERATTSAVDPNLAPQVGADVDGTVTLNVRDGSKVQPGMLANNSQIQAINWRLSGATLHAECSPWQPALPDTRPREFYLRTYSGSVVSQHADRSVDVSVGGQFSLSSVPLMPGMFGDVTLKSGEAVLIGFLGGSPSAPYAQPAQLSGDDAKAIALIGDSVPLMLPPMVFTGTIAGAPATGVLSALIPQTVGVVQGPGSQRLKTS